MFSLFELDHKGKYDFREGEKNTNKLFSVSALHRLWSEYKELEDIQLTTDDIKTIHTYNQELEKPDEDHCSSEGMQKILRKLTPKQKVFLEEVEKTLYVLELVIGSSKLENIPNMLLDSGAKEFLGLNIINNIYKA